MSLTASAAEALEKHGIALVDGPVRPSDLKPEDEIHIWTSQESGAVAISLADPATGSGQVRFSLGEEWQSCFVPLNRCFTVGASFAVSLDGKLMKRPRIKTLAILRPSRLPVSVPTA